MLFGNQLVTSEGERNTQMPQTIDSTSIYIMCTYIYLSNAYGNLDTRVNIHLWAEGHISVPLREQIHMKRVSGFTGPWKLDGSNTTPPSKAHTPEDEMQGRKEITTNPWLELSAKVLNAINMP